jgi:glycosyltransferase involved in cell wall biosynthesis
VKVALVVQRYGADINGGAEQHARYIAEHLARHVEVEVLTTCASDYITWRNERPAGVETVHGVPVRRFPVSRERHPAEFAQWSERVFRHRHSAADELSWLDAEGPTSPALIQHIQTHADDYDFFIFFSFRYYHSFHGARAVASKAILVPTAERDSALGLALFHPIFRGIRALMYNSFEERALIQAVSGNERVPGVVVGVGSEIPESPNASRFRQKYNMRDRFAIYVGRIDENKGCKELFDFFEHYSSALLDGLHLVLIGTPVIPIPAHPRIHHLGYVTDQDKFDAIAASELLIMPSYFESLSMVALEAWALGRPVLANAACDVLHGQCLRSNAGLFYSGFHEFFETLRTIDSNTALAAALGNNGRLYFQRHYSWPVIERKYTDMLDRLRREPAASAMEPLPGWWARRRQVLEPGHEVIARLPRGAAVDISEAVTPAEAPEARRSPVGRAPVPAAAHVAQTERPVRASAPEVRETSATVDTGANRRSPSRDGRDGQNRRGGNARGNGRGNSRRGPGKPGSPRQAQGEPAAASPPDRPPSADRPAPPPRAQSPSAAGGESGQGRRRPRGRRRSSGER